MSSQLTARQLANMVRLFDAKLGETILLWPGVGELEPSYTSRCLRPLVEAWVEGLRRPELLVRGDGGMNPPRALVVGSLAFYPDLEVVSAGHRYLAIEVKFLRVGQDPTGSLAKALGQAALYRELGFVSSHAVIVDLRPPSSVAVPSLPKWTELENAGIFVHWFRRVETSGEPALKRTD